MKSAHSAPIALAAALVLTLAAACAGAAALGTAITYQGRIDRSNSPASDTFSMIFKLYDSLAAGTQVGPTLTINGVATTNGLFSVPLDFGAGIFTNQARYLDVQVKGSGDAAYTTMSPRQPINAAPVALYALNGGTGSSQWISNGPDLTYSAGGVGVLGTSSPFASGKGVFIEGGSTSSGQVFAYNYDTFTPLPLILNSPGGNVGIGVTSPAAVLDVASNYGIGVQAAARGSAFKPINAAVYAVGQTGPPADPVPAVGLWGSSNDSYGVYGVSTNSIGVYGSSTNLDGTWGYSSGVNKSGVVGISGAASGKGGYFRNDAGGVALYSDGLAKIKTLQILGGADLAERFESGDPAEPGTVMAIDPSSPGRVKVCEVAYARTVAGVVSGANGLGAGVELSKDGQREGTVALALTGRVWVKCDAGRDGIRAGDLLTTSSRPGHAMAVADGARAQGAILGKAMTSLDHGTGLVLVLVSLQ